MSVNFFCKNNTLNLIDFQINLDFPNKTLVLHKVTVNLKYINQFLQIKEEPIFGHESRLRLSTQQPVHF